MLDPLKSIKVLVSDEFNAMNHLISEHLTGEIPLIQELSHHLIQSGGKRLRPLIVFLAARACNYQENQHIPLAAAVEYFHTASLLHDDVVDESALRRGKKSANEIWDNKACILVGDYLFSQSVHWMTTSRDWNIVDLFASTLSQMVRGEIKQLDFKYDTTIDINDYFSLIRSKTSLLFSVSAELGAHLVNPHASTNDKEIDNSNATSIALRNYGLHIGNAFQMIDDALDYCSTPEVLGKNIGDDLADGKMTLPLFCALNRSDSEQRQLIKQSIEKGSLENLPVILKIIEETKAIEHTNELARKEADSAIACIEILDESVYKKGLIELANFAVSRQY